MWPFTKTHKLPVSDDVKSAAIISSSSRARLEKSIAENDLLTTFLTQLKDAHHAG